MSKGEIRQAIKVQAQALGPLLHAGVATSLAAALTRNKGLRHEKYPHLLPLTMRAEMREFLEANPAPNGWKVDGEPRLMGQLCLTHPELNMRMRFLKERRRTYPGGVPIAGKSQARRDQWRNVPLDLAFPDGATDMGDLIELLLLWDFLKADSLEEFRLRIVHTLAPGIHGHAVPCDLILDVNDGGSVFSRLEFSGSPEDDDFFVIEIDEEEDSGS